VPALLAGSAWLATGAGAVAAPQWGGVQTVDAEPSIEAWSGQPAAIGAPPALGMTDAGATTAVWATTHGSLWPPALTGTVRTADRAPGGGWGAPRTLDAAAGEWTQPDVAVNGRGDAIAAWESATGGVRAAYRPAGGTWSAPSPLAPAGGAPVVAIDPNGQAHVAWRTTTGVRAATRSATSAWSAHALPASDPVDLDTSPATALAVDPSGTATLAWTAPDAVHVAQWRLSTGWVPRATYHEDRPAGVDAAAANGRIVLAWRGCCTEAAPIRSATGNVSGGWGPAQTIATEPYNDNSGGPRPDPRIALGADGAVTVLWTGVVDGGYPWNRLRWTARPAGGGAWRAPADLEGASATRFWAVSPAAVGVDAAGTVHAAWAYLGEIRVARRAAGAAWGPVAAVNPADPERDVTAPSVAVNPAGTALVAWQREVGGAGQDRAMLYRHDSAAYEDRDTGWSPLPAGPSAPAPAPAPRPTPAPPAPKPGGQTATRPSVAAVVRVLGQPGRAALTVRGAVVTPGRTVTLRLRFDRPARRLLVQVHALRPGGFVPLRTLRVSGAAPGIGVRIHDRGAHVLRVVWISDGLRRSTTVRVRVR
jgi:hypothetical protein